MSDTSTTEEKAMGNPALPDLPAEPDKKMRWTAANTRQAAQFVASLLESGTKKNQLKRALRDRYPRISRWKVEEIISMARELVVGRSCLLVVDRRIETILHLRKVLDNPQANGRDKLEALNRLHELLGMQPPGWDEEAEALSGWRIAPPDKKLFSRSAPVRRESPQRVAPTEDEGA